MDEPRNRGSPRLHFTEEELINDTLSRPSAKTESAAERYATVQKKLKKHYRLRLTENAIDDTKVAAHESSEDESFAVRPDEVLEDSKVDPKAPGVQNARPKPDQKKNADTAEHADNRETIPETSFRDSETKGSANHKKEAVRLRFEEAEPKKPGKLLQSAEKTVRTVGDQLHRQAVKANEDDNVALDAALQTDQTTRSALQTGEHAYHARKLRKYRRFEKAEKRLDRANIHLMQTHYQQEHPLFASNPYSRWQQKRAIKKEYAAAKREYGKQSWQSAKKAEQAVEKTGEAAANAAKTVRRHPGVLIILALGALLLFITAALQSCAPLMESLLESIAIGSYPAQEADVLAAEQAYLDMEKALKDELEHYEQYHPGYDEYAVDADDIWHDPYVLAAIISACFDGAEWDLETTIPVIERYFRLQYAVTETVTTKSYRDEDGKLQHRTVCSVTMENRNLSHLPVSSMTHHTLGMYALYMSTHGNMEGLFTGPHASPLKEPLLYNIPQETLDADPTFSRLMDEATKYIGFPYVWGGSDPDTSFDCSGFVCYVYTASGIRDMGRVGAKGIRCMCRDVSLEQLKPGDIVFFEGTLGADVEGITHCGIYVGNNMMLHCGSPIGYADLTDPYWQKHFHSYGRIPH